MKCVLYVLDSLCKEGKMFACALLRSLPRWEFSTSQIPVDLHVVHKKRTNFDVYICYYHLKIEK